MSSPCDNCGLCCTKLIIEIEHIDVVREPKLLPIAELMDPDMPRHSLWDNQYMLACGSARPCGMLTEDKKCSIYPTRPNTCVGFEVGCDKCNELREDYGLPPLFLNGTDHVEEVGTTPVDGVLGDSSDLLRDDRNPDLH